MIILSIKIRLNPQIVVILSHCFCLMDLRSRQLVFVRTKLSQSRFNDLLLAEDALFNLLRRSFSMLPFSVTRLGKLLDFGQLLITLATINLPKSPTFLGNFCKGVKIYHFLGKSFLGNFYRHLAIFFLDTLLPLFRAACLYVCSAQFICLFACLYTFSVSPVYV